MRRAAEPLPKPVRTPEPVAAGAPVETVFRIQRLGLLALGGLLGALAFPLAFPIGPRRELFPSGVLEPLAFVCLVPVLWAVKSLTPRKAFGAGFLAGMVFFTGAFWWVNVAMTTFGGMPNLASIPALMALVAWCALHWGLAFGAARSLERMHGWPLGVCIAPVWMAAELMRNYFCSGFPWANLGYSQMRNLWFSQVGSLAGVYGVAFCVALVNGALFEVWRARRQSLPFPRALAAAAALVLVGGNLYGALRVSSWNRKLAAAERVKVAVIQGNIDQKIKSRQGSHARMVLDAYVPPTLEADDAGADLIVWPEAAFPVAFPKGTPRMIPGALRREHFRGRLLLGVDVFDPSKPRLAENAAYLLSPDLRVERQYTKYHLVPFGEYVLWDLDKVLPIDNLVPGSFLPGDDLTPIEVKRPDGKPPFRIGVEICYDAIFPEISRTYARAGADLLVNLTNDAWYGFSSAPFQFLRMVAMRAVETGLPVARAANTGISAFIDPLGRISQPTALGLVEGDDERFDASARLPSVWRLEEVPLAAGRTVYSAVGDWPAYAAAAFSLIGLALGWARRYGKR